MSVALIGQSAPQATTSVPELVQENDAAVVSSQMSSDELVSTEDVVHTHSIILEGREELEQLGEQDEDADSAGIFEEEELALSAAATNLVSLDLFGILRRGAVNLVLPFINGIMLGFGEIFAHEIGFKYGFVGARVYPPRRNAQARARPQSRYI